MTDSSRKKLIIGLAVMLAGGIVLLATAIHVQAMSTAAQAGTVNWPLVEEALIARPATGPAATIPPPKQEPCLSCHITGENKNLWTPLARWLVFGTFGLVFAFGVYRSALVWTQRKPWKPLTVVLCSNL
ncbi:MAG: hypothetical protein AUK02_00115 [Anaerolineae bacterium CG2_30_58_95]|nr:MAG: hypothetical protein AUK02_00115 [Anaerolineae bacterium CG2_30_58_95]